MTVRQVIVHEYKAKVSNLHLFAFHKFCKERGILLEDGPIYPDQMEVPELGPPGI